MCQYIDVSMCQNSVNKSHQTKIDYLCHTKYKYDISRFKFT